MTKHVSAVHIPRNAAENAAANIKKNDLSYSIDQVKRKNVKTFLNTTKLRYAPRSGLTRTMTGVKPQTIQINISRLDKWNIHIIMSRHLAE